MSDYIDRDELIKHIKDLPTWWGDGSGVYAFYPVEVMLSIESAPAVDVQEIKHVSGLRTAITIFLAYVHVAERKRNIQAPLKKHLTMTGKKTYAPQGTKE